MAKPGFFEYVADRLVEGAESALAARLTSAALSMLAEGVAEPDRYAVLARLCPQALTVVLAEAGPAVEREASAALAEALEVEQAALDAELGAGRPGVAAEISAEAKAGVEQIIRRQNVAMADDLARLWYRVAGEAVARTLQGDSRRSVMEDAVRELADKGLETVDYASRRRCAIDAATRRHMVTQASQARARLLVQRCDEHEVPLVFTSAHYGARPSHAAWQGRPFGLRGPCEVGGVRYRGLAEATGYGEVTGLCGANCRHTFHPYSPGNTRLPDTRFKAEEAAFGQTSDERYEALQRQRELERRVRKYKRRVAVGQESGLDMSADRAKLGRAQAEVRAWCRANRLPRRYDLERAYGVKEQPRALGGVKVREKPAPQRRLKSGKWSASQGLVDDLMENELRGMATVAPVTYEPRLRTPGATRILVQPWGDKKVDKIQIGPQTSPGREELADTIVHEQLEARYAVRGTRYDIDDDTIRHRHMQKVIDRYLRLKGVK